MGYGFRLFTIEFRRGAGRKPVDLEDLGGAHAYDYLRGLIRNARGKVEIVTRVNEEGEPVDTRPRGLRFEPGGKHDQSKRRLRGKFSAGRYGDHDTGMPHPEASDQADTPLGELATSKYYRYVAWLPEKGNVGILAVESIGGACPVAPMVAVIRRQAKRDANVPEQAGSDLDALDEEGDDEPESGEWFKLMTYIVSDDDKVKQMIEDGKTDRVELTKSGVTSDSKRMRDEMVLSAGVRSEATRDKIANIVGEWYPDRGSRQSKKAANVSKKEGAREVALVLGQAVADLDFDDAVVMLEDPDGKTRKIGPGKLSEVFNYLVSDSRPSDDEFLTEVQRIVGTFPNTDEFPRDIAL